MERKTIKIDAEKCSGCGLCVQACHEGAIGIVDGKARLLHENYCDGLGNCLPVCPTMAISFEEHGAVATVADSPSEQEPLPYGCPGTNVHTIGRNGNGQEVSAVPTATSELRQWPVQIKLVPVNAPYFKNAHLLIAADCAAYAYGEFHGKFMKDRITIIGCPKLDGVDYSGKLAEIITGNDIKSVTAVRMEVPCCGGIEQAVITALKNSGKNLPSQVFT
ncbi:MAG: 4Fe-4S binding protein, partial [Treponema sp.]|nr:4Fe-4S binding protein [Treponema sp.]